MYLKPRMLGKKFLVEEKITRVDETGRAVVEYKPTGEVLFGVLSYLNPKEVEQWQGTKHFATDVIIQKFGRTKAAVGDKLVQGDKVYLVQSLEEVANSGWRLYYVKERGDLR